jgi:hypothetical protein
MKEIERLMTSDVIGLLNRDSQDLLFFDLTQLLLRLYGNWDSSLHVPEAYTAQVPVTN